MISAISAIFKNMAAFQRVLDADNKFKTKAAQTAGKVEGFRLSKELKAEIREGAPGGKRLDPLSEIALYFSGRKRNRKPLSKLAAPVAYNAKAEGNKYRIAIGYLTEGARKSSKSIQSLVERHAQGFSQSATEQARSYLRRIGGKFKKRRPGVAKYFFLLPKTAQLKTPARPIIEPFWRAHKHEIMTNIALNFKRKMKGERI